MFSIKKIKSLKKKSVNMFILGHKVFFVTQKNYLFFLSQKIRYFLVSNFLSQNKPFYFFLSLKISGDEHFR